MREIKSKTPEAFISLAFELVETMQFDWGDVYAYISNVKTEVSIFCAVLPYSFEIHASVFLDKSMESFFMDHIKAFKMHL